MGAFFGKILAKVAGAASGPLGWLASLLIDRILNTAITAIKNAIAKAKKNSELKKETKQDEGRADKYGNTLKDGVTEKQQIDATLDVLNGTDRTDHH